MSKCKICVKSVYPMDPQINLDGSIFHKPCAKCEDCKCQITISNFTKAEVEGKVILLCKIHYFKRFKEGGSYVGGEKFQVKAARDVQATARRTSITGQDALPQPPAQTEPSVSDAAGSNVSVKDRVATLRVTEKPAEQTPGLTRRPSVTMGSNAAKPEPTAAPVTSAPPPVPDVIPAPVAAAPEPVQVAVVTPDPTPVPEEPTSTEKGDESEVLSKATEELAVANGDAAGEPVSVDGNGPEQEA